MDWISVDDRIPDDELISVLVKADTGWGHIQHFAAFIGSDEDRDLYWIMDFPQTAPDKDVEIPGVTHWKPIE